MRSVSFLTISLLLLSCIGAHSGRGEEPSLELFGIKSGQIEYQVEGSSSGTETLFWDDWGRNQARYSHVQPPVLESPLHVLQISTPQEIIWINLEKKTGLVFP